MAGAKTGAGNIQDETGTSCHSRKYGNAQKNKTLELCQKNTGAN